MKKEAIIVLFALTVTSLAFGCGNKATDEQINKMCANQAELTGEMRGTSEKEEIVRIEEEHKVKEQKLKDELARDLKGWDDVVKQRIANLEKEEEKTPKEKEGTEEEEEKTPEEKAKEKEDKKKEILEDSKKKKQALKDAAEPFFKKLKPNKERAIRKVKEYVKERQQKAQKYLKKCAAKAKKEGVTEEIANCRINTVRKEKYSACR